MRRGACLLVVTWALACFGVARVVSAQTPPATGGDDSAERAAARALFEEGVALAQRGEFAPAVDRFRRSRQLRPLPVVTYNLAVALAELHQLVEASELLREVLRDANARPELQQSAQAQLDQVLPRMSRLTIRLEGERRGALVLLDDRPVPPAILGVAAPVDPGEHHVLVRRGDREVARATVRVAEGREETVTLRAEAAPSTVGELSRVDLDAPQDPLGETVRSRRSRRGTSSGGGSGSVLGRWWFWAIVGGVAAGAAAGVIVATSSGGTEDPYRGTFMPGTLDIR